MKIIAIDSSGLVASVAILENDKVLAEYSVNFKKTHSQTLVPMLDEIRRMIDLDLNTIDAVAVAGGPGSFTGLRIGSATAKGLGLALSIPVISVPTVDALSFNLWGISEIICPIMDARRNQVYTGLYRFEKSNHIVLMKQCAISIDELIEEINSRNESVIFLGDGVPVFRDVICEKCSVNVDFAPPHMNAQRAGALAVLAAKMYREGKYETAAEHKPDYLRLSQAERERLEKQSEGLHG